MELELVPVIDELVVTSGDEAVDLTVDEAEAITSRIRIWANSFPTEDVVRAYRGRIWVALAYSSWAEWCECELGGLKLPVPQRREVVAELAGEGMSNRAIADAIGSSEPTVRRDVNSGASYDAPDRTVTGQDGKTYTPPAPKPSPEPEIIDAEIVDAPRQKPRRRPLVESAREIGLDLKNLTARMERLLTDDRLARNKNEVAPHLRHYLAEVIKVCQDLNHQLT